jgi:hypothetical protein
VEDGAVRIGGNMGSLSIWHWIILLVYIFIFVFPIARILGRVGLSGWWSILAIIPLVNLIALWVFAFASWPRDRAV